MIGTRPWKAEEVFECVRLLTAFVILMSRCSAEEMTLLTKAMSRIEVTDLKRHVATLASDSFEGREAGTNGGKAASAYLVSELKKFSKLEPAGIPLQGGVRSQFQEFGREYRNLLVSLPGSDPELSREVILIGAHYDHVGRGNQTNSFGPFGYIHNGADDNASGTSALLELIDAFTTLETSPKRTLLFAFWDAEEIGLLGSKHWISQPTRPIKDIRLVVNIDMLGRLRDGKLTTSGWRTMPGLRPRLTRLNTSGDIHHLFQPDVVPESDHYPFYQAGVPCLHFDSCKHDDYHRPSDDADRLNYEGLKRLSDMVFLFANECANQPALPAFRREVYTERPPVWLVPQAPTPSARRLGVQFEPKAFEAGKAVISGVASGSPADRAGVRSGDEIVGMANWDGRNVDQIRTIVQVAKSPVLLRVRREKKEEPIELRVELPGSPVRLGIEWETDATLPECVVITRVIKDSPADRSGIKAGDIVMTFNGNPIVSETEFGKRVRSAPGPFQFEVDRAGRPLTVSIELFDLDETASKSDPTPERKKD